MGCFGGAGWGRGSGDIEADAGMHMELSAMWDTWVRATAGTGGLMGRKIRIPISRSRTQAMKQTCKGGLKQTNSWCHYPQEQEQQKRKIEAAKQTKKTHNQPNSEVYGS